jgi:GNAT superfamily N-acetyltransferase
MIQLQAKKLTIEETKEIYAAYMHRDFPPEELKPFYMIEDMWSRESYFTYGFYENVGVSGERKLRAYAFFVADNKERVLLLDYFAAVAETRGQGYGSAALQSLKTVCSDWKQIVIEVEDNELELPEKVREIRNRRIAFYTGNGCLMTTTRSWVFGVDYRIMVLPVTQEWTGESMAGAVTSIYHCMHCEELLEKNFRITME